MAQKERSPKLFLLSLVLPIIWIFLGTLISNVFPETQLGMWGLLIIIYLALTAISFYMAKFHQRYFDKGEKIRLVLYLTVWAIVCESWALWYYVSTGSNIPSDPDALYFSLALTGFMDLVFIFLGVHYAGKQMFDYFNEARGTYNA